MINLILMTNLLSFIKKAVFLLCLLAFVACSDDDDSLDNDSSREYSTEYSGVYLDIIDGVKVLCYTNYDTENLRRCFSELSSDDYFNIYHSHNYAIFGVPNNYTHASKLDYYDLIGYGWDKYNDENFLGLDDFYLWFWFYDNGKVNTSRQFQRKIGGITNSYDFVVFKLYSISGKLYLKFMFFDTKGEQSSYGDNFECLTINDLSLKSEKTFLYIPMDSTFAISSLN